MIITQTPLRLSLLGGNTDFPRYFKKYGGVVLTTTIDKYIYCIVKKRFDDQIWVNYSKKEVVNNVRDIKHDIVRECLKFLKIRKGVEITFLSDIPSEGSGLGSSSAVTVGLLNALHHYKNDPVSQATLAVEACKIEVDILRKPIGYQDQYAVAFGGTNLIRFGKKVHIQSLGSDIYDLFMLFYTGFTRKSEEILSRMKFKKDILDKNKQIVYRVFQGEKLGDLMHEYWELKKKLNPLVTTPNIDYMYFKARKYGAIGGKIVGAGGGGFLLLVVPKNKQAIVRKKLKLRQLEFGYSKYGSRVIFPYEENN